MYTLMQGGCHHVFYWPCKRPSTDVKLVAGRVTALPCLGYSNVSVGPGCALYRDDRFLQLAVEIFRIQCAEDFFKVSIDMWPSSGRAYIHVQPNNKQGISYNGNIVL